MTETGSRLALALLAYALWTLITVFGPFLLPARGAGGGGLYGALSAAPGWHFLAAAVFAAVAARLLAPDGPPLGFPRPARRWRYLVSPLLFIPLMIGAAILIAPGRPAALGYLVLNTLLIAISEELIVRHLLLTRLTTRFGQRRAILWSSLLFAAVHLANLPVTGLVGVTLMQAVAAGMSGVLFAAIVIKTGSLLPAILFHWLWNIATLLLAGAIAGADPGTASSAFPALLVPLLLVFPNFAYAVSTLARDDQAASGLGNSTRLRPPDLAR